MATANITTATRCNINWYEHDESAMLFTVRNPTGPLYDSTAVYYTGDVVHKSDLTIWTALQDAFSGQTPAENSYWTVVDPYWDLTGMTLDGQIRTGAGETGTALATFTITLTDPTNGEFTALPVETSAGSLVVGSHRYDIFYTDTGGTRRPLCYGTWSVNAAVTIEP